MPRDEHQAHAWTAQDDVGEAPEAERPSLIALAERLDRERAVPRAGFRGELRRRLLEQGERRSIGARVRVAIAAYGISGSALLFIAGIGLAGAGPLAP